MGHQNINTFSKKGTHFNWEERLILEHNYKRNKIRSSSKLAEILGKSSRTIRREINRGFIDHIDSELKIKWEYSADLANTKAVHNFSAKGPQLKVGNDFTFCNKVKELIVKGKYSPDAVIMKFKKEGWPTETRICTRTLYSYIEEEIIPELTKNDLVLRGKQRKRGTTPLRKHSRSKSAAKSISKRPKEIEKRKEFGHWEMDCVVSGKGKGRAALLVLTERKYRYQIIRKICDKTTNSVIQELNKLEKFLGSKKFREIFKTITNDNGSEFMDYENAEKSCLVNIPRTTIYYAHPYCSGERGSNENANKLIRRFIKKGSCIGDFSKSKIKEIELWINNYPRRILKGYSSNDLINLNFY